MRGLTYAAVVAGMFYGAIAAGATSAEAARCPLGQIYRPSLGVCQLKAKAVAYQKSRFVKRYANASLKHRYKRPARSNVQKAQNAPASSMQNVNRTAAIPSLRCDEICQLHINLASWVQRNRGSFE